MSAMPTTPKPQGTADSATASLLIHDWRWHPFDEDWLTGLHQFPSHGWLRSWLEETENGLIYEVRDWYFGPKHPDNQKVITIREPDISTSWPSDVA